MEAFTKVTGIAAPMPAANIDTDVIMPKVFLKGVDRAGLRDGLFHDLRFDNKGAERTDFVLNRPRTRDAKFLIVGPNFGCGSSREHAVWGLMQYGIRALIGTSYAGIFFDNCGRNGLAALTLEKSRIEHLLKVMDARPGCEITVDLETCSIDLPDGRIGFEMEDGLRRQLLEGRDAIDETLTHRADIELFQSRHLTQNPWLG